MTEHLWAWKRKSDGALCLPPSRRSTLDELFRHSSFGLPIREVGTYVPIRVKFDGAKWIEDVEDEKDRLWRLVVESSST